MVSSESARRWALLVVLGLGGPAAGADEVPYESHPFAQTHPSRLFTVGTLFGRRPTPVQRCRVLEIGCAAGGNLIPMAAALPDSEFVGIDASARQIDEGQQLVKRLGLKNVTLKKATTADVDAAYGRFDYVICHGVFSWVPTAAQDTILDVCAKRLTPNGIAYISYNTYPGWHLRGMIRDMMRYHSGRFNTAQQRTAQARALLEFLAQSLDSKDPGYSRLLKQDLDALLQQADQYLYHEHLAETNTPVYFHQFAERAEGKGLKYLGEARVGTMVTGNFGPEIEKRLRLVAADQIEAEQYMDVLRNRMFRETLLGLDSVKPNWAVNPESLRGLHVAGGSVAVGSDGKPLTTVDPAATDSVKYRSPSGMTMETTRPLLKAAMKALADAYPGTVSFDDLRKRSREAIGGGPDAGDTQVLAVGLLNCYKGSDLVELHGMPVPVTLTPGEKPRATALARDQAARAPVVTNRRHEVVRLNDLDRHLVPLLDGTNDRAALVVKLARVAAAGRLRVDRDGQPIADAAEVRQALTAIIDQALANVARMALLEG